jgi:23S rRNA (cytidine1920-2'-O)/16S rRNA (cytidine1409-2'-O)-methyltransferase
MRIDQFVSEHFQMTRSRAQLLIKDGAVRVTGKLITKSSYEIPDHFDKNLITITDTIKYVSRAGLKLEHAINEWGIRAQGKNCLDIGSSTGGFTDCLLQYGACHVDCVDVGTDQLHEKIKTDPRVSVFEQTDIRNFTGGPYDIIGIDVSFISLSVIIPVLDRFCNGTTQIVALIKPQFEVGKEFLNKQGIVKNMQIVNEVLEKITSDFTRYGFTVYRHNESPILGGDGNQEYLLFVGRK